MRRIDAGFSVVGIEKHVGKDQTAELNGTIVGIDLVRGTHLFANASKLRLLLPALLMCLAVPGLRPLD